MYTLSANQYGKAEIHLVRIYRDSPRHEIRDLTVTTSLRGDFEDAYTTGDQSKVLPTDTQKNTAFAFAKTHGEGAVEDYALALGRHFVDNDEFAREATIEVLVDGWDRVVVGGAEHEHTWVRRGPERRTVRVDAIGTGDDQRLEVTGGVTDLVILKSTGSEFHGFHKDEYTTLGETDDRILATSIDAAWRFGTFPADWDAAFDAARAALVGTFATWHSLALQQTLWQIGQAVLDAVPELAEVKLAAPNKHHFLYDFSRFTVEPPIPNDNEVFHADDRPYGLIEATVTRS
jgi:urate oxidase